MTTNIRRAWQAAILEQRAAEVARLLGLDASLVREPIVHARGNGTTYRRLPLPESNKSRSIAKLLVEAGADVNAPDPDGGAMPLSGPSLEVGVYLIEQGADIDAFGYEDLTPLAYAVYDQNRPLVEHLIGQGADVNRAHRGEGISPLHYAARKCAPDMVRVLIRAGADPALQDAKGETPLDWAREAGRGEDVLSILTTA